LKWLWTEEWKAANFCRHRIKSIPPKPNYFVADLSASFVQKIFHVTD